MAEIKKAISSRRRYRAHLTKLLQNVEELLRPEQPLTEGGSIALRDTLDQLQRKETLIAALDAKILESLVNDEEVEAKVLQAEEIHSLISTVKTKITYRLTPLATPTYMDHTVQNPERTVTILLAFLPHFSGNPMHWQPFRDSFEAAMDTNRSLIGVQKLSYLRTQL